ncbi:hypothetical protein PQX77_014954 [Marasmius sp. AFHP31]|nr:hypothetical protein PQX77_014954 [Marasmius sp. AFHP31]
MKWPLPRKKLESSSSQTQSEAKDATSALDINGLPNELLMAVFSFTTPTEGAIFNPPSRNALAQVTSQPLCLSQVCSRWRALTRCMPELWASLTITRSDSDISDYPAFKTLLLQHFELSDAIPLSIRLPGHVRVTLGSGTGTAHLQILDIVRTHSHRLKSLDMSSLNTLWKTVPFGVVNHGGWDGHPEYTLPILESLSFSTPSVGTSTYNHSQLQHLLDNTHTPNLKKLQVHQCDFWSPSTFTREFTTIPYTQLHSLTFKAYSHIDVHHILSSCPALVCLAITFASKGTRSIDPIPPGVLPEWHTMSTASSPISLPKLRILSVTFPLQRVGYDTALSLFTLVAYPSLETLKLRSDNLEDFTDPPHHTEFWDTVAKSFTHGINGKLVRLGLEQVYITDASLKKLITTCSSTLKELSIRDAGILDGSPSRSRASELWTFLQDLGHPESDFLRSLRILRISITTGACERRILTVIEQVILSRAASLESVMLEVPESLLKRSLGDLDGLMAVQRTESLAIKVLGYPSGEAYIDYEVQQNSPPVAAKHARQTEVRGNKSGFKLAKLWKA